MRVLFVCEGNMMRSQMAELFYNSMTHTNNATSAGAIATMEPSISKRASEVLAEVGISSQGQYSKQLSPEMIDAADKVILFPTDYMPDYAVASPKSETWDIADPHYNQQKGMDFVREVRDEIRAKVTKLIGKDVQ